MTKTDLDVMTPEQFSQVLRNTADKYRESALELQSAWQDNLAGICWREFAAILDSAAKRADAVCVKHFK